MLQNCFAVLISLTAASAYVLPSNDTNGRLLDRLDRYNQWSQNGLVVYSSTDVKYMQAQYDSLRSEYSTWADISRRLQLDLQTNKDNIRGYWNKANADFSRNPNKYRTALKMPNGANFPDECHIALIVYSMESFFRNVYWKFNSDTRRVAARLQNLQDLDNLGYFLTVHYITDNTDLSRSPGVLYRGTEAQPTVTYRIGAAISMGSFTSTSEDFYTALNFSERGSLIIFYTHNLNSFIPMKTHSEFPDEEEYLLSPLQLNIVEYVDYDASYNRYIIQVRPLGRSYNPYSIVP